MASQVATLLFTDIEGSTRLWEVDAGAMSDALAQHDSASRAAVEQHRGTVLKMTGDGMYASFDDPLDAVEATAVLQQSLANLVQRTGFALRVRAGLHTGIVERRDNDLFGSTVNRAARIMKAAHGGQILLSQAVAEQVREQLTPHTQLRDLGSVRLRDLASSEHVFQLVHPGLREDFPALRSLEATPNNLPLQSTSFVGRDRELRDAKGLLQQHRLLTLLGMGGMGKTRLALQVAADVLETFEDGVWFLDLAPIRDPALVPHVAAQALGVHDEPGQPILHTLCAHLRDCVALLVLDNCEHLVEACASFAHAVLHGAPRVRIVATSREALRIAGEQTYPVAPLGVPNRAAGSDAVLQCEAVQLFVERARLQRPDFAPNEGDTTVLADLCARLEGIPLAIELAAARIRSLSIADINARLSDRFKLLTGGNRTALERQQTLRALVSWSYDLLQKPEQILLDRLSCFAGGFDLDAAEAVCAIAPIAPEDVFDLLTSLVDKSLVMVDPDDGGSSRYGMLETIREFAHNRHREDAATRYDVLGTIRDFGQQALKARDEVAMISVRYCDYFLELAKTARRKLQGPEQAEWIRRLETELGNLRAAIALALAAQVDPVIAVKLEVALMRFRTLRGYASEGRSNLRLALALPQLRQPNAARAHALYTTAALAMNQGDHAESTDALTECLAIRRVLGDQREIAATLSTLATQYLQYDEPAKARECEEEALEIFRGLGDRMGEGIGLLNLGEIAIRLSDLAGANELFERALDIAKSINHQELQSECERDLGELALRAGDLASAARRFARSLETCRDAADKRGEAIAVWWLGKVDVAKGQPKPAREKFARCLLAFRDFGMNREALDCLDDLAELIHEAGRDQDAALICGATAALRRSLGLHPVPESETAQRMDIESIRASLGAQRFEKAWSRGSGCTLEESIKYGLECASAVETPC